MQKQPEPEHTAKDGNICRDELLSAALNAPQHDCFPLEMLLDRFEARP